MDAEQKFKILYTSLSMAIKNTRHLFLKLFLCN